MFLVITVCVGRETADYDFLGSFWPHQWLRKRLFVQAFNVPNTGNLANASFNIKILKKMGGGVGLQTDKTSKFLHRVWGSSIRGQVDKGWNGLLTSENKDPDNSPFL